MTQDASTSRFGAQAIARLIDPASIAIVGASDKSGALGASVLANLERNGFDGTIHLINPKRDSIGGHPCLASADDLPEGVDCAVLAIPRPAVLETMRSLAARKVGSAIIFSAGFAEDGDAGIAEQNELAEIAAHAGMLVEGPNCLGCVNHVTGKAMTFVETECRKPEGDGVAIVSQSGAMAAVLSTTLQSRGLPISYSISTGNEAVSGVEDYLEWLEQDAATSSVAMIVEHFRKPQRFLASARKLAAAGKRVILLHPGRSAAARESAATHTGAIAGDHAVMRTLSRDAGVLLCDTLQELGDVVELGLLCPPVQSGGVAVVGESGAFKALTLDLLEQLGVQLATLSEQDNPALRAALPDFVPVSNPLDITAMGLSQPNIYTDTLTALLDDDNVSAVVLGIIQTDETTARLKFPAFIRAMEGRTLTKPLIYAGLDEGADVPEAMLTELRNVGIPVFPSNERVFRALKIIASHGDIGESQARPGIALEVLADQSGVIPEYRAKALLAPAGIAFPAGTFATDVEAAVNAADKLGYPVALKAQSANLGHKSEAGGVKLNLADEAALRAGWQSVETSVKAYDASVSLDGMLVEAMGERGIEMIVGARRDPDWGSVLLVGFGGVTAELLGDVCLIAPDMGAADIEREILSLRQAQLLTGFRGSPKVDVAALANLVARLGDVMRANERIVEVDLNPVIVGTHGVVALDALMEVAPA